jgi:pimeloyl-ACP methyl ester carboxylesterase
MKWLLNGHEAYAYTGGKTFDPSLPCVAFVHGALNDHSVWTLLARWFAHHGWSVLAVDLPGHGRSAGLPLASVEDNAQWLLSLLQAAGAGQAALVGHSMGSLIALQAAADMPPRVSSLVMVGTAYPMKVSDTLLNTAREQPLKAIDMVNTFAISTTSAKPSYPGPGAWLHGGGRALARRLQAQAERELGINLFAHDFGVCDRYAGGLEAAAAVRCPATLVLGTRDQMTNPKSASEMAAALKGRTVHLPVGHALMAEAPDAVLNALRQALGEGGTQ